MRQIKKYKMKISLIIINVLRFSVHFRTLWISIIRDIIFSSTIFSFELFVRIILFRRMGTQQCTLPRQNTKESIIAFETTTFPESHTESDPLHSYISKHPTFIVKTLSDLKNRSNRQNPINSQTALKNTNKVIHSACLSGETLKGSSGSGQQPQIFVKIQAENNQNNERMIRSSRSEDATKKFKVIPINSVSFITVKKEHPENSYDFKEVIGEGSYGQVFRAVCKKSGQIRAVKVLKARFMKDAQKNEFLAQMTLLSQLNHPSIITLYQLFHYKKKYYVVMQYCKGGSIIQILKQLKFQSQEVISSIVKQLLRALSYMHSLGIVHRDIKLENIVFLNNVNYEQGYVPIKIIDFGTAVKTTQKVTQNYPVSGTLSYLPPEVMKGVLIDRSDIWSSGVLMYILLTGISPFRGRNEVQTRRNINEKNIEKEPSLLGLSQQAKDLLSKMLNRNYYKRISASEALGHPWFQQNKHQKHISVSALQKLQHLYQSNNLISIIQSYLSLKKITQDQRQKLAEIFTSIDSDGNGLIDKTELVQTLRTHMDKFKHLAEVELDQLISSMDKNNSGKIDFNQFIIAMYDKDKLYIKESLNEAFEYFDSDHTGYIQIDELKQIMGESDQAEVEYFINTIDKDNDKRISREEFVNYLLSF